MDRTVTWETLAWVAGVTVVANASVGIGVAWIIWHVCRIIAELEKRLLRLEILEAELKRPPASSR